jgi:hypothetical protein
MAGTGIDCPHCGKVAKEARLRFQGIEIKGWKCRCGEEYFDPEEAQRILLLNKVLRRHFEVRIGQIRSNLIIRIPTELADALGLRKGDTVKIKAGGQRTFQVEA